MRLDPRTLHRDPYVLTKVREEEELLLEDCAGGAEAVQAEDPLPRPQAARPALTQGVRCHGACCVATPRTRLRALLAPSVLPSKAHTQVSRALAHRITNRAFASNVSALFNVACLATGYTRALGEASARHSRPLPLLPRRSMSYVDRLLLTLPSNAPQIADWFTGSAALTTSTLPGWLPTGAIHLRLHSLCVAPQGCSAPAGLQRLDGVAGVLVGSAHNLEHLANGSTSSDQLLRAHRRLGERPRGKQPPRGVGQFALPARPASTRSSLGRPHASASLGQLADRSWLARSSRPLLST